MIRKSAILLIGFLAAGMQLEGAKDFERSYPLLPDSHVSINNSMGDIHVSGYKGDTIKVVAKREGPDSKKIRIDDKSFGPRVDISPMIFGFKNSKTRVDFEVMVPQSAKTIALELRTFSGKIEADDLNADLFAYSIRGAVNVENVQGNIFVNSVGGNINASIKKSGKNGWMKFASQSGNIKVTAPKDFDAHVQMITGGDLKSDFSIPSHRNRYGGQIARGQLGKGTQNLEMSSVWGSISLLKKADQQKASEL